MDSAIDVFTGATVEAEQLWMLESVNKDGYACRGCFARVIPCSYQPHNKVRPYFKVNDNHNSNCDVDGDEKLVERGCKERLSSHNGIFPTSYPAKLVLRDFRPIINSDVTTEPIEVVNGGVRRDHLSSEHSRPIQGREVNTIRLICRTFIQFPYDRDLPLDILGIEGKRYISIFKRIAWGELQTYLLPRIFYAPIRWNKIVETSDYMEVMLDAGRREERKLIVGHKVRINCCDWSQAKRTFVRNDLETSRLEAIKEAENKTKKKAYLFFIGEQDKFDLSVFHVSDHRLICCIVDEIVYPQLT